ncbi:UNVERIFIED_CONTAM: hypothetical protein RKD50_000026 [Streptomyces canus]
MVKGSVAERGDLLVEVLGHRADLGLRQLGDPEGFGEFLDPAGGDAEQVGGGDHRDQGLFGPSAPFEQPVQEVITALPQLGNGEFDGAGAGVPLAWAVAVAVVDAFVADLAVFGVAEGVGLRGHECVGERLDHCAQQIGTRRGEVVFREGVQGQTAWCGHRADLLRGFDTSKISRWPFIYAGAIPMPEQTPGSDRTRTPLPWTQPIGSPLIRARFEARLPHLYCRRLTDLWQQADFHCDGRSSRPAFCGETSTGRRT